jgi:hypothetical protein
MLITTHTPTGNQKQEEEYDEGLFGSSKMA